VNFLLHSASVSGNGRCQVLCKTAKVSVLSDTARVTNSEHARHDSDRQLLPPVISSVLTPPILSRGSHVFIAPIFTKDRVPRSSNLLLHLRSVGMRPQVRITKPARRSVDSEAPGLPDVQPSRFPARSYEEAVWLNEIAACFAPGRPPSGLESLLDE
jgi:hypothetical protein